MNTCVCGTPTSDSGTTCQRCAALHELGLRAGATDSEVKDAYRLNVKAWHPDRFPGDEKSKSAAQEKLKTINSAYNFLASPSSKKGQTYRPKAAAQTQDASQQKQSSDPPPEVQSVTDTLTDESEPIRDGVAGTAIRVGTLVFGAFSAISLLVSIVKGLVPIYLLEAAGWAGLAWYWQGKKTHSELAKAIVIVLAVLVAIGEVVHVVSRLSSEPKQAAVDASHRLDDLFPASTPPSQGETQDKANIEKAHPKPEPKPREETRAGLQATITCDNTVWDRDKYGEGDPLAITNVHKGDVVQYVGHVTVGDEDIIRVHGRKGYVDGCVDVTQ